MLAFVLDPYSSRTRTSTGSYEKGGWLRQSERRVTGEAGSDFHFFGSIGKGRRRMCAGVLKNKTE